MNIIQKLCNREKIGLVGVVLFVLQTGAMSAQASNLPDFSDLIEKASPAVVKIDTVTKSKAMGNSLRNPEEMEQMPDIFRQFFDRQRRMQRPEQRALGSGFIISNDGFILTNNHVIKDADEIKVMLSDQREFSAKVIGADPRSDVALIKIEAKNLPQLILAKNVNLKVGQWVVAIGSPFGLEYSASAGIVSALGRSIPSSEHDNTYVPFIQTDVAVNPGNSGGPLFNMDGEVIGINSQIISPSGASAGISLAIPSNVVNDVLTQLKQKGHVDRGWLGVVIQDVNKDLAQTYGLDKAQGALVAEVLPDGPAEKAGIKAGDLIIQCNGEIIHREADLPYVVGRLGPNSKASVNLIRKGKAMTLDVVLGKLPDQNPRLGDAKNAPTDSQATKPDALGLSVKNSQAKADDAGVEVISVAADSAAEAAGVTPGDIITQLNFVDIDSLGTYQKILKSLPKNEPKSIRILRNGRPLFRSVTIK